MAQCTYCTEEATHYAEDGTTVVCAQHLDPLMHLQSDPEPIEATLVEDEDDDDETGDEEAD